MKKILVTGGVGFIGTNLLMELKKFNYQLYSLDNYSSGSKKNHINDNRVKYLIANTLDISKILKSVKKQIHSIFHFGEFARIYQSFKKFDECFKSNSIGSNAVFKFCLNHNRHFKRDTFLNAIEKASQEIEQAEKKWSISNIVNDKEFFLNK